MVQQKGAKLKINITVESNHLNSEKKQEIESSIELLLLYHRNNLKNPTAKLLSGSLSEGHVSGFLSGPLTNEQGEEEVQVTYQLSTGATIYRYSTGDYRIHSY